MVASGGSWIFLFWEIPAENFLFRGAVWEFLFEGYIIVTRYESQLNVMQCSRFSMNIINKCHFKIYVVSINKSNSSLWKKSNSDAMRYYSNFMDFFILNFAQNLVSSHWFETISTKVQPKPVWESEGAKAFSFRYLGGLAPLAPVQNRHWWSRPQP